MDLHDWAQSPEASNFVEPPHEGLLRDSGRQCADRVQCLSPQTLNPHTLRLDDSKTPSPRKLEHGV